MERDTLDHRRQTVHSRESDAELSATSGVAPHVCGNAEMPCRQQYRVKDEHGNVLSLEQACALNYHALADQAQPELDEPLEPDGYFLNNEIQTLKSDLHDLKAKYEALEMQVAAISGK